MPSPQKPAAASAHTSDVHGGGVESACDPSPPNAIPGVASATAVASLAGAAPPSRPPSPNSDSPVWVLVAQDVTPAARLPKSTRTNVLDVRVHIVLLPR